MNFPKYKNYTLTDCKVVNDNLSLLIYSPKKLNKKGSQRIVGFMHFAHSEPMFIKESTLLEVVKNLKGLFDAKAK